MLLFTLSMPCNNSWNGRWTGEGNCYARARSVSAAKKAEVLKQSYHTYSFGDGWVAAVSIQDIPAAKARRIEKQGRGFCGYDWMIDSIIKHGDIRLPERNGESCR